jgi:N-acetylglucosamine-6-phosphate deacetylase
MKTVITAARLVTPEEWIESPRVIVEDGRIVGMDSRDALPLPPGASEIDLPGMVLAPGFIDIHVHGGAGHDVMETGDQALSAIERHMARHGVTSYLATTVTAPQEKILRALEHLSRSAKKRDHGDGACTLGIHLEGPFISHAKRGVHPPENLVPPSPQALETYWQASAGTLRMLTVAPELPGAIETIQYAQSLGVISSLGHSDANFTEASAAITAGAAHATHTFNAMRALDHREPGILGAVLAEDRVSADIIADGIHLHPNIVKLFLRAKGHEQSILITDAISAAGMPDGRYRLGALEVNVKDGRCDLNGKLAGSVLTLDRAVRNVMSFAGWTLQEAVRSVTVNPARLLGIAGERGLLAPGCVADLVVLTPQGEVVKTLVAGRVSSSRA